MEWVGGCGYKRTINYFSLWNFPKARIKISIAPNKNFLPSQENNPSNWNRFLTRDLSDILEARVLKVPQNEFSTQINGQNFAGFIDPKQIFPHPIRVRSLKHLHDLEVGNFCNSNWIIARACDQNILFCYASYTIDVVFMRFHCLLNFHWFLAFSDLHHL